MPVILYQLSKRYYSPSEFAALVMAALFPLGKSTFDLVRQRRIDPIAIVVLLGITTDGVAMLFGGSPRLLLVRESLFTGAFGAACFASLLLPRPMMFYFSQFQPAFHFGHRSRTVGQIQRRVAVSGSAFLPSADHCSLGMRICRRIAYPSCAYRSPACRAGLGYLAHSIGALTITTIIWAFRYGHQVRLRALARFNQLHNVVELATKPD